MARASHLEKSCKRTCDRQRPIVGWRCCHRLLGFCPPLNKVECRLPQFNQEAIWSMSQKLCNEVFGSKKRQGSQANAQDCVRINELESNLAALDRQRVQGEKTTEFP